MATDRAQPDVQPLPEFDLIERWFERPSVHADVELGIGDDAALTRVPEGQLLVTATDMLVEGTHFLRGAAARSVGHRALAVNLSDVAAMGAEPRWASLAICLPAIDAAWLDEFAAGFFALAERSGVALIGGDTVRGPLSITVTLQGLVAPDAASRRSGAQPGDRIFVTGSPGAAAAGRSLLGQGEANRLSRCFEFPEPRLAAGKVLGQLASAVIDISDGLHADLGHLLRASGCGATLAVEQLPLGLQLQHGITPELAVEYALLGGEDFELVFSIAPERLDELHEQAAGWGCSLTQLGVVTEGQGLCWTLNDRPFTIETSGFRHF